MKKSLVIDARWLHTGIGSYVLNVLTGLRRYKDGLLVRAIARKKDAHRISPLCDQIAIVDLPIYTLREQIEIPWAARGAELLHVPHYNAPLLFRGKLLVTIFDLVHLLHPTFRRSMAARVYARPMLNLATSRACHIITISEYSKEQIVEHLRVSPRKVTVIYIGVNPRFRLLSHNETYVEVAKELGVKRPFLLYVGNLKPHKNLVSLFQAFALLRARRVSDHLLLIIGEDAKWKQQLVEECSRLGIEEHVLFVPYVSDDLLPQVYAAAELLILPSLIEGFGLPVVEAMACGTPVACSRAASLPEVAGDAAEYFDPSSVEDIAAAIQRVLESSDVRATLRTKGLERANLYSWDECGRRHYQLYRDLLEI